MKKYAPIFILFLTLSVSGFSAQAQHQLVLVFSSSNTLEKGKAALENGEIEKAISLLNSALRNKLSPQDDYSANNDLCVAYYLSENFEEAMKKCNRAIRNTSNKWVAYNNRGNVYLASGKYNLAIADYEKGLQLKPSSEVLSTNLQIAHHRMSGKPDVRKEKPSPKNPEPLFKNKSSATAVLGFR